MRLTQAHRNLATDGMRLVLSRIEVTPPRLHAPTVMALELPAVVHQSRVLFSEGNASKMDTTLFALKSESCKKWLASDSQKAYGSSDLATLLGGGGGKLSENGSRDLFSEESNPSEECGS